MSKLFATAYIKDNNLDKNRVRSDMAKVIAQIRYVDSKNAYRIRCLNMFFYLKNGIIEEENIVIPEEDMYRLIKSDNHLSTEQKKELLAGSYLDSNDSFLLIKDIEKGDLPINYYYDVCFMQKFYTLTVETLKKIKTEHHRYLLGRSNLPWLQLNQIAVNKHGGRPAGSGNKLPPEEHERILDNLSRWDAICHKYVSKGIEERFVECLFEIGKLPLEELPSCLRKPFLKNKNQIRWYYYALRFNYKLSIGVPEESIKPGRKEIGEKIAAYGLPCNI